MVSTVTIRVKLPHHLRNLARVGSEIAIDVSEPVTLRSALDALEKQYPMLRGTIREHTTLKRRAYVRFFTCGEDWSHESPDTPLPEDVLKGREPLMVVGAIAGG